MANMLGITLIVTALISAQTALSLIFDARWRDFPFAALTMAVVPFWTLAFLNGSKSGERPLAGFRTVEECQGPERHHRHGQGGEREIAPAGIENQAERGLR